MPHNSEFKPVPQSGFLEQIGEPELARHPVFQHRFLRLQFAVCQRLHRWSANPVTLVVLSHALECRMALITCPDCEQQISPSAATCPNCGRPMSAMTGKAVQTQRKGGKYEGVGFPHDCRWNGSLLC